ncbi:MAG: hypothetical protein OEM52_12405, partial [bacterium]|nr:hypothetical protein [bacterium]
MHWLSRSLIALLSIVFYTMSFAQPVLTWTSPVGTDSSLSGWITLRDNPVETKFYRMTSTSIQIMNGPTSTTISFTIPIVAEEWDYFQLYPILYTTGDITGDGRNEIVVTSMVGTSSPYRYGFRFVNSTTGANVIIFNNPSYSYYLYYVDDMDNNNLNELIVMRYNFLLTTNEYNYLYY